MSSLCSRKRCIALYFSAGLGGAGVFIVELEGRFYMNHMFKITVGVLGLGLAVLGLAGAQERFDMRVRNDFFAGFAGNSEALDRGMKLCEEELARNPANAAAL